MNQTQEAPALGVSAGRLALAYGELFPGEFELKNLPQIVDTMSNWLDRFREEPEKAVATTNWAGKVTQALFHALGLEQPKTKKAMLEMLTNPPKAVRIVEYELDYIHRIQVAVPSVSDQDAIARAEEAFDNATIWDDRPDMPLLYDDYEESEHNMLEFHVVDTVASMKDLPPKDASAKVHHQRESARMACSLLLLACEEAKKAGKDSISLDDLAAACDAALCADSGSHKPVKVLVEIEGGTCIGTYATAPVDVVVMDADKVRHGGGVHGYEITRIDFPDGIQAKSVLSRGDVSVAPEFVQTVFNMKEAA